MTRTTLIRILAATAALTTLTAGVATADPAPTDVVHGDVDGDGVLDRASVVPDPAGGYVLRVDLATGSETAALPDDDRIPGVGLRVTDLDVDGVAEIAAPVSVGANTVAYQVFLHEPGTGLVMLSRPDGHPFALYEGGGVSAVNGYGCATDHDDRHLVVVGATLREDLPPGGEPRYEGFRTTYAVADSFVTVVHTDRIEDAARTEPILQTDPEDCTPAG